jgi:hypothetical protein
MYALFKVHWRPSYFARLPFREKATVIAMIKEHMKQEERERKKPAAPGRRGHRRRR